MKKRVLCAALLAAVICAAAGCGTSTQTTTTAADNAADTTASAEAAAPATNATAAEVADAILAEIPINSAFDKKLESLGDYFDGLATDTITDAAYRICASGAYPDEVAIFKFASADDAKAAVSAVNDRLEYQKKTYKDYTPEEYYKLEDAVVKQSGEWLYYLVTSDNSRAQEIAESFIG